MKTSESRRMALSIAESFESAKRVSSYLKRFYR